MIARPIPALGLYELEVDLPYQGGIVPKGFRWNGASFPRVTWTITGYYPSHPKVMRGSCGHDYDHTVRRCPRRVADDRFRITLIEDGVEEEHAAVMHALLRQHIGAWIDDEDLAELARRAQAERDRVEQAS